MADLFTPTTFRALRTELAHLTTATHSVQAAGALAANLHAVGQLADVLRHSLTDPAIVTALTVADTASTPDTVPPGDDDLDWEALATGPQTEEERNAIFALLHRLAWPYKRIANMLHKYCAFDVEGVPPGEVIDDIATLDGHQSAALIGYLERHFAKQQETTS